MTKIIVAFAGTGKTTATTSGRWNVLDSDSDKFQWIGHRDNGIKNPSWPLNFINHPVEECTADTYDAVLMSAYIEFLPQIVDRVQAPITFVYPSLDMKSEFEARYRGRENPDWLVNLLVDNFDEWITALADMKGEHVVFGARPIPK